MRRAPVTIAVSALILALAPAAALAGHAHKRHHQRSRSHHARIHHVQIRRFGHEVPASGSGTTTSTTPAPAPAGTVKSFDGSVLTITLADGSTVAGAVTSRTEIECRMAGDDDATGEDGGDMRTADQGPGGGDDNQGDDQGGDYQGEDGNATTCGTAALTPGAVVQDARLIISSTGASWERIDLVQ
jgi:hypothetical protein